jgi:spermidine/putrescine transport system ATP-binding protein
MSRSITIENVTKSFHGEPILENINLSIPGGGFFALLGPSGCGKTTLLRLIGGFESVDAGEVYLGNKKISHLPINKRRINTVFQNYALFPHLSVYDNVAYSLSVRGRPEHEIRAKVKKIIAAFDLDRHLYKSVKNLSGGQQQRVALARAIITEPDVLLLDEPLAALDVKLRERMLLELIDLQDSLKTTFVYVTHDQLEALTVADQMAIMNVNGEIEQIGTPKDIYEFPISSFVAKFVGTTNILRGYLRDIDDNPYIEVDDLDNFSVVFQPEADWVSEDRVAALSIRPEKIVVTKEKPTQQENVLYGTVDAIVYHGRSTQYNIRLKNNQLMQVFKQNELYVSKDPIDYDDAVYLYWEKENAVVLKQ